MRLMGIRNWFNQDPDIPASTPPFVLFGYRRPTACRGDAVVCL